MIDKEYLMIPGPTPVPPRVMAAMALPMKNHRGPFFKKMFQETRNNIKKLLNNPGGDVFLIPSSGTGAMELAVQNFTSKGDRVLVVNTGFFGERFAKINMVFGREVLKLNVPWGKAVKPGDVVQFIKKNDNVKAIFITHNETSSGIINNIKEIIKEIKNTSDALIIVDAVSSIGISEINMQDWGIDVVVAASQKGLMTPPGIGIVSISKKALDYAVSKTEESLYFSVKELKKKSETGEPFTTFPVLTLYGLREGLNMLIEEGFENAYKRHEILKKLTRASLKEIGLKFVANEEDASPCITAVFTPESINADEVIKKVRERYNVEIAEFQGDQKSKGFRIGHMGFINSNDLLVTISAVECALCDLKHKFGFGEGTKKFLSMRREYDV